MDFTASALAAGFTVTGPPLRGGSGTVYRAFDNAADRMVALKVLAPGVDVARLRREAAILSDVHHPGVAAFRSLEEFGNETVLVVDWVEGSSIAGRLRSGDGFEQGEAAALMRDLSEALDALHGAGIVHRDITSENVLIDETGRPVLIDFGLSRTEESATVTVEGAIAGTPRYLAPEVITGEAPTARSDQYAAAVLFNEMLVGSWPFPDGDALASALHHQLHTAPTPADEVDPSVPVAWSDAILRGLEKEPAARFPDMASFLRALDAPVVKPLSSGRRLSVASIVFRFGLPLVLVAALLASVLGDDADAEPDSNGETPAESADEAAPPEETTTTALDRSDSPQTTDAPPETVAPTTTDAAERVIVASWAAGTAEQLACNLLTEADFETPELPINWYKAGEDLEREQVTVLESGGVDDTGALQIGEPNLFGIWGEVVDITPGVRYLWSANVRIDGPVFEAGLSVDWVDVDWAPISSSPMLDIVANGDGQLTLVTPPAPDDAVRAVPRVFKDNGEGLLFFDEPVFAREGSDCEGLLIGE